jgi:GAG-pre-integrase domain
MTIARNQVRIEAVECDGLYWVAGADPNGPPDAGCIKHSVGSHVTASKAVVDSAELWHRRVGHLGYDNLHRLVKDKLAAGLHVKDSAFKDHSKSVCAPCVQSKHARSSFRHSECKCK